MELEPKPLPKDLANLLKENKIEIFNLSFEGGNDEGCLDISMYPTPKVEGVLEDLTDKIQDWAWDVYSFSGAGDGNYYGTSIDYDLQKSEVTVRDWYDVVQRVEENPVVMPLKYKAVKTTKKK
jgi:hypothetical protein